MMKRLPCLAVLIFALSCLALSAGCAHMSVSHLARQSWVLEAPQTLETEFWRFEYTAHPETDRFRIRGRAYPTTNVPQWALWVRDLWFEAYLSGERGKVLADDLRVYQPRELDRTTGVYFEFILKPSQVASSDQLFLTFGYRAKLSDTKPNGHSPDKERIFFASEGALTRL